jgi:hypothetical protein
MRDCRVRALREDRGANLQGMHTGVNHLQRLHDGAQLLRDLRKNM